MFYWIACVLALFQNFTFLIFLSLQGDFAVYDYLLLIFEEAEA